ncbi:MAG TPA: class I SAM-dependent methyltransferase [Alcaligenes sp.]|nr:class I SAM-dependent methyltransferase [Alcaligenes sp.]HRL26343.1 class I SAM-dependent methyltransferase [Alcaligenes sp.]
MSALPIHTGSRLFQVVADMQGGLPWGHVLDAGTGRGSMNWLLSLPTDSWTAITGAQSMAEQVRRELGERQRPQDRLVVGNWTDPQLLQGEQFDTVLADYLLGAMDGFAPYAQDQLFARLRPLTGQRLYIIGLEPYVPYSADEPAGALVVEIGRLRDACLLLAGERPYREYPMDWVLRHLRQAGFRCLDAQRFGIRYGERFIHGQLDMCTQRLRRLQDRNLALALSEHVETLRRRALALCQAEGGLRHGHDYVICAQAA